MTWKGSDAMPSAKNLKALKAMGGRVTTVGEFLGLSDAQMEIIDLEIDLAEKLKAARSKAGLSQAQLAAMLKTSQATVARMEQSHKTSVEALLRALRVLGLKPVITFKRAPKPKAKPSKAA